MYEEFDDFQGSKQLERRGSNMAITAEDIHNVSFSIDRKGYDVDEVDVFLEHVADEIDIMNQRIDALVAELDSKEEALAKAQAQAQAQEQAKAQQGKPEAPAQADAAPSAAPAAANAADAAEVAALKQQVADLQAKLDEKAANDAAISQALIVAQRSADEILANARSESSNIIKDADEEADRIVSKAEADRQKIIDSIRTLEADRSDVRAEYRDMLANFMADAQKKLAEIDGDARRSNVTAQARAEANASAYDAAAPAASQAASGVSAVKSAIAPSASGYIDKDFSGFGAADSDFAFDDID